MTITPAYGTDLIHLGQTSAEMQSILGSPSKRRRSGSLREYWVYRPSKFEAIVSRKTGRLLSLFFHEGCPFGDDELLGGTEAAIYSKFAKPTRHLPGIALADGKGVDTYIAYDEGIGFFLNDSGRAKTVCVTAKKRKVRAPVARGRASASHRQLPERLAALRVE